MKIEKQFQAINLNIQIDNETELKEIVSFLKQHNNMFSKSLLAVLDSPSIVVNGLGVKRLPINGELDECGKNITYFSEDTLKEEKNTEEPAFIVYDHDIKYVKKAKKKLLNKYKNLSKECLDEAIKQQEVFDAFLVTFDGRLKEDKEEEVSEEVSKIQEVNGVSKYFEVIEVKDSKDFSSFDLSE